jgi:Bacterial conjugation TrbI-like protein
MNKTTNEMAKGKQRRTLVIVLLCLAALSLAGVYFAGGSKPAPAPISPADTPKLTNVMTPGASIGDKDGWRAVEGAKIEALIKRNDEFDQRLKTQAATQEGNAKVIADAFNNRNSNGNGNGNGNVGGGNNASASPELSRVGNLEPKRGGAVDPKIINLPGQSGVSTPGVTQGGAAGRGANNNYPPNNPNSPGANNVPPNAQQNPALLGTAVNGTFGYAGLTGNGGAGKAAAEGVQGAPQTPPAPKSRIVRVVVDAQDSQDAGTTGAPGAAGGGVAGSITGLASNNMTAGKRAPLFDASKMSSDNPADDASPTERVSYQNKVVKEAKNTENYLPGGTFAEGFLLSGMDAPSGGQAQNNPVPVLIMLSSNAYLPSKMRSEVKDCVVVGTGYGDISSERAYIRTESISCVKADGTAIDMPLKGYIAGEDGKAGIRGRLVSKQGQILANALTAGFISGLGGALHAASTTTTLNPLGGSSQTANPGEEVKAGFGASFGKSMDRLAAYYISLADKTFPVIEIDARRKVTVVISKGTYIDNRVLPKEGMMTDFKSLISINK